MKSFDYFDHPADVGLAARGDSIRELFEAAASGLVAWSGDAPASSTREVVCLEFSAEDPGELLVRWLQEIVYLCQVRRLYFVECDRFDLEGWRLTARVCCIPWTDEESGCYQEIKAVTYHQLKVEQNQRGVWSARVILDI